MAPGFRCEIAGASMSDLPGQANDQESHPAEDRSAVDRAIRPVRKALRWLGLALLVVMICLPALQVALRTTPYSFIGAGELTRFMLICVVFVTLPYVISSGASIRMEDLIAGLPESVQRIIRVVIPATGILGFGFASYSVAIAVLRNLNNATPTLGIPYWIFFSAAFVGLFVAAVECAIQLVKALHGQDLYVSFAEEQPPDDFPTI
jgi:TRAP-type C4-dicarboxylate transport system permease small subunit